MGEKRIKVAFLLHALTGGGAEKVVTRILRHLDRERFHPLLILIEKKGYLIEEIPIDVPVLDCGRYDGGGPWKWMWKLKGFIREQRPDVLLSFLWFSNVIAVLARYLSGTDTRLILSERSTVIGSREGLFQETLRRIAIRFLYRSAEKIVVNADGIHSQFTGYFRFPAERVRTIHNPLDMETILVQSAAELDRIPAGTGSAIIVAMGRFSREKGFDLLIRAIARIRAPAKLLLLGEGREEKKLRRLVEELGVSDRVEFLGFRKNPYPVLRGATLFVLPSRYEGFPNGLAEAMALGVPCVATRCKTGPEEIIADGENGLLVPVEDPDAMAGAIDRLIGDPALRERLGASAQKSVRKFNAGEMVRQYESLIESVVA